MRLSYEEQMMWMVEMLEKERESLAAQAACALMEDSKEATPAK